MAASLETDDAWLEAELTGVSELTEEESLETAEPDPAAREPEVSLEAELDVSPEALLALDDAGAALLLDDAWGSTTVSS